MNDIKHITNIFPNELLKDIQKTIQNFKYVIMPTTVPTDYQIDDTINDIDSIQEIGLNICHIIINDNNILNFCVPEAAQLLAAFQYYMPEEFHGYELVRMQANLMIKDPEYPINKYTKPHYDSPESKSDIEKQYKTILFYVNESDGNTVLFDVENKKHLNIPRASNARFNIVHEQPPIENSALIFSSDRLHAMRSNTKIHMRFAINIVLKTQ